ncbi:MAG: hypothetical protein KAY32_02835 [Candidatus Eisenbacteria sp.]|nr:hypothetical protein [Candidatus Eisenbacteria bacterium]
MKPCSRVAGRRALAGLAVAGMVLLASCAVDERAAPGNQPPLTYLSVMGESLNTVSYHIVLRWDGTDRDGEVIGFAYHWDGPWNPEPDDSLWWEDSSWVFTSTGADTFDVPVEGSYIERTFSLRAIDNDLLADPDPVTQLFSLYNQPPLVSWTDTTRHPTFAHPSLPAISFAWTPEDYDGRETIAETRLWLDTQPGEDPALSQITVREDTVGAFFPEHFQGRLGPRTIYLQVFDRARTGSDTISWSWEVVAPAGEYLLIDNAWPTVSPARIDDAFWRGRMNSLFGSNYHIYDVEVEGPFRSSQEVLPIFDLFKGVLWYGIKTYSGSANQDEAFRLGLERAQGALEPYVRSGGELLLTGLNVLGTGGGLSRGFYEDVFGISRVYTYPVDQDVVSNLVLDPRTALYCGERFGGVDSLVITARMPKTECFAISDSLEPLLWVGPGTVDTTLVPENATDTLYVGALAEKGLGKIAIFTTLLTRFRADEEPEAAVEALMRSLFESN